MHPGGTAAGHDANPDTSRRAVSGRDIHMQVHAHTPTDERRRTRRTHTDDQARPSPHTVTH